MLVRIDEIISFFNRQFDRASSMSSSEVIAPNDLPATTTLVPMANDKFLQTTNKEKFFISLENFRTLPGSELSQGVIEILRQHPTLFSGTLDEKLEGYLLSFRNHLQQNNPIVISFFLDMMKSLTGANLSMARKVLTIALDSDIDTFLPLYLNSPDSNCIISSEFIDNIPFAEKVNELQDRKSQLDKMILNDGYPNSLKAYAQRCLMVTNLALDKIRGTETNP